MYDFNLNNQNRLNAYGLGIICKDSSYNYIFIKKEIESYILEMKYSEPNYLVLTDTLSIKTDIKVIIGTYESITIVGSIGILFYYYFYK